MKNTNFEKYANILNSELVPALGCTEPIAIAYVAAVARQQLSEPIEHISISCSGNIIKNVQGVIVPYTGGLKGIKAAIAAGILCGKAEKKLEVLCESTKESQNKIPLFLENTPIEINLLESDSKLHLQINVYTQTESSFVELVDKHTNIIKIIKNDTLVFEKKEGDKKSLSEKKLISDKSFMKVDEIIDYCIKGPIEPVKKILEKEINCNTAISNEGLKNSWGANIGKTILELSSNSIETKAKAATAAGSDARMSGCLLPVFINSGSGNQGLTVSLPVIQFAKELKTPHEKLIRALMMSNLIAIHEKETIGVLSAYCGAVSAAAGASGAITWLRNGTKKQIKDAVCNTLANVSGIICDGAKPSCAIKIASAVDAAIMASNLALKNTAFCAGEGIVKSDIEHTIKGVGKIASDGMLKTDKTILEIMIS